jgi:hypothetical protein
MRGRRTRVTAPIIAATIALSSMAVAGVGLSNEPPSSRTSNPTFRIRGAVKGMYPGRVRKLRLRIRNPLDRAIRVRSIRARVRRPHRGCPAKAITIRRWRGHLRIRPHRGRTVRVKVKMKRRAPNACQGARFPIRYRGTAVRA